MMEQTLLKLSKIRDKSYQEVLDFGLNEAVALSSSKVGYIYFYNEDTKLFTLYSWSKDVMKECSIMEKKTVYDLSKTGLWGEAVRQRKSIITNDYNAPNPHKKGYPQGHVPINRHLNIPIFRQDKIVAVIGVGNKETEYTDIDVEQLTFFMDSLWDIVERIKAEEDLKKSEQFVRNILDTVDEGFIVVDRNYNIITANKAYCLQSGEDSANIIGKPCYKVSHGITKPCFEAGEDCSVQKSFETGKPYLVTHKHVGNGAGPIYVEIRSFPLLDDYGNVTSAIEVITNVTEKRLLDEERIKTQKLEAIGTLAGGIAHDFNNLLQGVFGYLSLARIKSDDKTSVDSYLDQAEKAMQMATKLTNQLLTFSKGGKPIKKVFDLSAMINTTVKLTLSGLRTDYRISEIDTPIWNIDGDEGQISQVIQNIVLNADQAMPESGEISITLTNKPIVNDGILENGNYVEISIKDTGIGIPEKYIEKIFDPYFTTKDKGSGLGLATSYSIIKNHKGTIKVKSILGEGTTFYIYLPAVTTTVTSAKAINSLDIPNLRILLMDDEDFILHVGKEIINTVGCDVVTASNGEEAIKIYKEAMNTDNPINIVILDLTIRGGMGGDVTLKELLKIDPNVKAIISSGYSDDTTIYEKSGFKAVLTKPYTINDLKDIINKVA